MHTLSSIVIKITYIIWTGPTVHLMSYYFLISLNVKSFWWYIYDRHYGWNTNLSKLKMYNLVWWKPSHCVLSNVVVYYRISRPIRCTVIFSLENLEKNNDECILILVIYWKKTGLLHTKFSNNNIIYSS